MNHKAIADLMAAIVPVIKDHFTSEIGKAIKPLVERLEALEAKGDQHVQGEKGEAGAQGPPGEAGQPGQPGAEGQPGAPGPQGEMGLKGDAGDRGRDGIGIAGAAITREGELMVTLTDGTVLMPGKVDGRDGLSLEDMTLEHDGDRTTTFVFARGDVRREYRVVWPIVIYRGVFETGRAYVRGDTVTHLGSMYHCNTPTEAHPNTGSPDWTLAVKHGRDGRNGRHAAPLDKTPVKVP
jgi:hypothetical protein